MAVGGQITAIKGGCSSSSGGGSGRKDDEEKKKNDEKKIAMMINSPAATVDEEEEEEGEDMEAELKKAFERELGEPKDIGSSEPKQEIDSSSSRDDEKEKKGLTSSTTITDGRAAVPVSDRKLTMIRTSLGVQPTKVTLSIDPTELDLNPTELDLTPNYIIEMSSKDSGNAPEPYSMETKEINSSLYAFSETNEGSVAVEGQVVKVLKIKPEVESMETFLKQRIEQSEAKRRRTKPIDNPGELDKERRDENSSDSEE